MDYETGIRLSQIYNRLDSLCRNFCCTVKSCLGIIPNGDVSLVLNQQGNWIVNGTGGVSQPLSQVIYGTGSGITSDSNFTKTASSFNIITSSEVNTTSQFYQGNNVIGLGLNGIQVGFNTPNGFNGFLSADLSGAGHTLDSSIVGYTNQIGNAANTTYTFDAVSVTGMIIKEITDSFGDYTIRFDNSNGFEYRNEAGPNSIFKVSPSGNATFNSAYTLPNSDGTSGQTLTTDGAGNVAWQSPLIYSQTATKQIINTTVETSLLSSGIGVAQIPAGVTNVGTTYQIKIRGFHSNNSFDNLTVRIKIGGTTITSNVVTSGPGAVNTGAGIDVILTFYSVGVSGTYWLQGTYNEEGATSATLATTTVKSLNTTVNQAIDVSLQWGTATNSDQWTVTNFIITKIG